MVVQKPQDGVANANGYHTCRSGQCLMYTRTWLEIGSRDPSAAAAWANAARRHHDRDVPKGAPVFWTGGSRGYGHIALSVGNGQVRSTDCQSAGSVSTVSLDWIETHWGQHYEGWTEDLNGVVIPYLIDDPHAEESRWASGDVYVEKLHQHQRDSDSVARLCYRLVNHKKMPGSHRPAKIYRAYNEDVLEAVRYWQRNIAKKSVDGPTDGTKVSNQQANHLFGDNYKVHEK